MRVHRPLRTIALVVVASLGACTSLEGLVGSNETASPVDGTPDANAESDGGTDAPPSVAPGTPVTIATNVDVAFAAGAAQQTHLHYAKNSNLWVLFYIDAVDTTLLKSRASEDFVTWSDGPSMTLPRTHGRDGRNFAVTYLDVGGRDVFHFSVSLKSGNSDRRHVHARGVIDARKLTFETVTEVGSTTNNFSSLDPDVPGVTVIPGGKVIDVTGWHEIAGNRVGNMLSFVSTEMETGGAWSPTFATPVELEIVQMACNARAIVPMTSGALATWEEGDDDPNPRDLRSSRFDGSTWAAAAAVGFTGERFDPNDWGIARADDANVHAVRVGGSTYAHRVFDGTGWKAGAEIPSRPHASGHGIALVAHGGEVIALSLDGSTGTLGATTFAGSAWSMWKDVVPASAGRSGVSGYAGVGGVAAIWVETNGSLRTVVGAKLR